MPVTRIEMDRGLELIKFCDEQEPASGRGRLEAEHGKLDYRDSSDDEEVRLLPHRKGADEPDPPGSDICDTQRDEWLLKTEPLQGARLKWNKGERPPVIPDRTGVLDLEATGGVVGRKRGASWIFTDVRTRDVGSDRRDDAWSPGNVLVDTVARMQQDLADIRAEKRLLRTPGVPPVVHTPRQAAFTTVWWDDQLGTVPTGF